MTHIDLSLVEWSRAQFALTAIYHWIFVPLTLGLSFLLAIMESIYVKTGDETWKPIIKFWMTLFGINFAIGVATGIILEFEFGTNWSNYSWFVGDIFGAPLAIEGIMAFFLESTFIAVMFFGWGKVSKKFHLLSTWLVAFGSNLSALWILVANSWMQFPTGTSFNPETARNEMVAFWDVLFSPVAVNKFLHTISSGYVVAAAFMVGISAWYIIKGKHLVFARRSILIASIFGLTTSVFLALTGDGSAYQVAQKQPMKLAAMEGLYEGEKGAGLVAFGVLKPGDKLDGESDYLIKMEIPKLLSFLGHRNADAFVPGVKDLTLGNESEGMVSAQEKINMGRIAISALKDFTEAKKAMDIEKRDSALKVFNANYKYFGYGYLNDVESIIPNIPLTFYSFRIMVALGFFFIVLFALILWFSIQKKISSAKWILVLSIVAIPLSYLASQTGWIVAEVGRQPWVIQDLMPTVAAVSRIDASHVQITFWLFAVTFTVLLIAELRIMFKQIFIGPKEGGK